LNGKGFGKNIVNGKSLQKIKKLASKNESRAKANNDDNKMVLTLPMFGAGDDDDGVRREEQECLLLLFTLNNATATAGFVPVPEVLRTDSEAVGLHANNVGHGKLLLACCCCIFWHHFWFLQAKKSEISQEIRGILF
jgi:hypothetical protein